MFSNPTLSHDGQRLYTGEFPPSAAIAYLRSTLLQRGCSRLLSARVPKDHSHTCSKRAARSKRESFMSGAPMAAAVSVCCATLVAALVVMIRRRSVAKSSASAPLGAQTTYGSV